MKKSNNRVWLILGIIVIVLGVLIPFVFLNQSTYYDYNHTTHPGTETYEITITSKEKIKNIEHVSVELDLIQGGTKGYEIYSITEEKTGNKYEYKCKLIVREDWVNVKEIDSLEIKTADDTFAVSKKLGLSTKIPVAVFICVVGGFMIFIHFFNNNSKNRVLEMKEIIMESARNTLWKNDEDADKEPEIVEQPQEEPKAKVCEYCGSASDSDEKVCKYCGAKFKIN